MLKNRKVQIIIVFVLLYIIIILYGLIFKKPPVSSDIQTDYNYSSSHPLQKNILTDEEEKLIKNQIDQIVSLKNDIGLKNASDSLGFVLSSYPSSRYNEKIKSLISQYIKESENFIQKTLKRKSYYSDYPDIYDYYKFFNWSREHYEINARVLRVFDGDTVRTDKGIIRFTGIDTPEMNYYKDEPPQRGAVEATNFVVNSIDGREIKIIIEKANEKDRYDRYVGIILYGENFSKCLNIELMLKGYAEPKYYWLGKFINRNEWVKFNKYFKY